MVAGLGESQRAASDAIAESVETTASDTAFDERRQQALAIFGFDPGTPTVTGGSDRGIVDLYARLTALSDKAAGEVPAIVMAETLDVSSALIDPLGQQFGIDMAAVWQPDDAMLDLIRDRAVLGSILAEVAGASAAEVNERATGKVKRQIVCDCLTGGNGRDKVTGWVPPWLAFPAGSYADPVVETVIVPLAASLEPGTCEPQIKPLARAA